MAQITQQSSHVLYLPTLCQGGGEDLMTVMEEVKISFEPFASTDSDSAYKTKKHPDVNFQLKLGFNN